MTHHKGTTEVENPELEGPPGQTATLEKDASVKKSSEDKGLHIKSEENIPPKEKGEAVHVPHGEDLSKKDKAASCPTKDEDVLTDNLKKLHISNSEERERLSESSLDSDGDASGCESDLDSDGLVEAAEPWRRKGRGSQAQDQLVERGPQRKGSNSHRQGKPYNRPSSSPEESTSCRQASQVKIEERRCMSPITADDDDLLNNLDFFGDLENITVAVTKHESSTVPVSQNQIQDNTSVDLADFLKKLEKASNDTEVSCDSQECLGTATSQSPLKSCVSPDLSAIHGVCARSTVATPSDAIPSTSHHDSDCAKASASIQNSIPNQSLSSYQNAHGDYHAGFRVNPFDLQALNTQQSGSMPQSSPVQSHDYQASAVAYADHQGEHSSDSVMVQGHAIPTVVEEKMNEVEVPKRRKRTYKKKTQSCSVTTDCSAGIGSSLQQLTPRNQPNLQGARTPSFNEQALKEANEFVQQELNDGQSSVGNGSPLQNALGYQGNGQVLQQPTSNRPLYSRNSPQVSYPYSQQNLTNDQQLQHPTLNCQSLMNSHFDPRECTMLPMHHFQRLPHLQQQGVVNGPVVAQQMNHTFGPPSSGQSPLSFSQASSGIPAQVPQINGLVNPASNLPTNRANLNTDNLSMQQQPTLLPFGLRQQIPPPFKLTTAGSLGAPCFFSTFIVQVPVESPPLQTGQATQFTPILPKPK